MNKSNNNFNDVHRAYDADAANMAGRWASRQFHVARSLGHFQYANDQSPAGYCSLNQHSDVDEQRRVHWWQTYAQAYRKVSKLFLSYLLL